MKKKSPEKTNFLLPKNEEKYKWVLSSIYVEKTKKYLRNKMSTKRIRMDMKCKGNFFLYLFICLKGDFINKKETIQMEMIMLPQSCLPLSLNKYKQFFLKNLRKT